MHPPLSANPGTHDSSPQPLLHGSRIPAGTAHDMQRVVAAVIRRGDALLVCHRREAENIKKLVPRIPEELQ